MKFRFVKITPPPWVDADPTTFFADMWHSTGQVLGITASGPESTDPRILIRLPSNLNFDFKPRSGEDVSALGPGWEWLSRKEVKVELGPVGRKATLQDYETVTGKPAPEEPPPRR